MRRDQATPDPLIPWLALEREAVWFYPAAGARSAALAERARASLSAHMTVRDRLVDLVTDDTTSAEPAYDVGRLDSAARIEAAARAIERKIQAACLYAYQRTDGRTRAYALQGLRRSALAELTWGGEPQRFPGLDR